MRVSIVGTGRIGFSLEKDPLRYKPCTHIGAIETLIKKGFSLEWDYLCDIDPEKLSEAVKFITAAKKIKMHPKIAKSESLKKIQVQTTTDYRAALDSKPGILIIATDTNTHFKIISDAIKAKIPRIVLEKPIALNYRQAGKIYSLANKTNAHIWINYERRYHSKYMRLRRDILNGEPYGAPLFYRGWFASSNSSLFKTGVENEGALLHDTTHLVDLALFLFGDVKTCKRKLPGDNIHQVAFTHKNGVSGEILTTSRNRFFHFEMEIIFERARVKVGNGFTIVEKVEKSKLYKNFISLSSPRFIPDKKMAINENPFVNLYTSVFNDEYETSFLKDACQNIKYLT